MVSARHYIKIQCNLTRLTSHLSSDDRLADFRTCSLRTLEEHRVKTAIGRPIKTVQVTDCLNLFETRVPVHNAQIIIALNYSVNKIQLKIRPAWVVQPRNSPVPPDRDGGKAPVLQAFVQLSASVSSPRQYPPTRLSPTASSSRPWLCLRKDIPC